MSSIDPHQFLELQKTDKVRNQIDRLRKVHSQHIEWVEYDVSYWAGRLGNAEAGLVERVVNSMDATSMMHADDPYGCMNMRENLEDVDKDVQLILEGAKRSTENVGYNITVSDQGKGQKRDNFDRFVRVEGSGGNKNDLPIAQGCRMLGSLASVANSQYVLILSSSYDDKGEWTWTLIRRGDEGYKYLKIDDEFPTYTGVIDEVGTEENKDYGTVIKLFDYEMSSPERAASGNSFRRMLAHRMPEPPIPVRILDKRWDNKYVYEGVSSEVQEYENLLTGKESFTLEHDDYGLLNFKVFSFDMSEELAERRRKFISTADNSRLLVAVNGQTHYIESPQTLKTSSGLGEASSRSLVVVELLETSNVKEQELFQLERRGFKTEDIRKDFVEFAYENLGRRIDPSNLVPESEIENVSRNGFNVVISDSEVEVEESDRTYLNMDIQPYINKDEQTVSVKSMDDMVTVDLVQAERREIRTMVQVDGLTAGDEITTDILFSLDGNLACSKRLSVSVYKEEEQEESETEEEGGDNDITIRGNSINGFPVPEDRMTEQEVRQVLHSEVEVFAQSCYKFIDKITLEQIGYNQDGSEFYDSVTRLSSSSLEEEIANKIRNMFVSSEETKAGYLAEDIATELRASDNESEKGESLTAGLTGCEPDLASERYGTIFGVQLKMGVNTMNSDMEGGFDHAKGIVDGVENQKMILGIVQGTREQALANIGSNISNLEDNLLCGKELFYWLTGNEEVSKNFYDILADVESELDLGGWQHKSIEKMIDKKARELAEKVREEEE